MRAVEAQLEESNKRIAELEKRLNTSTKTCKDLTSITEALRGELRAGEKRARGFCYYPVSCPLCSQVLLSAEYEKEVKEMTELRDRLQDHVTQV